MVNEDFTIFLKKQYGDIMSSAEELTPLEEKKIIPTLLSLDIALGGGIPQGSIVLLSGRPKIGKTTLALQIVANAIEEYKSPAFYIRVETNRLDKRLTGTIDNLKHKQMQVIPKDNCDTLLSAQQFLNIVEEIFKHHKEAIVVLDSIAALSTEVEMTEDIGANKEMGSGVPKLLASFFRKTSQIIQQNNGILILLSQFQASMNRFGKSTIEKGGNAIQYHNNTWIIAEWSKLWEKDKNAGRPLGHDTHFKVNHAPLGPPYVPCKLPLRFGFGYDRILDVIENAINFNLIEKGGAWYTIDGQKFQGTEKLYRYLKETGKYVELDKQIRQLMFNDSDNTK